MGKNVQQIIIISEHDAQIMGFLIDCGDCTVTETSNYRDVHLVMRNDEWDTHFFAQPQTVPCVLNLIFCPIEHTLCLQSH